LALLWSLAVFISGAAAESLQETMAKAKKGDAAAQCSLGERYASGDGTKKDPARAKTWFEKAAAQGHPGAQTNLGLMYAQGDGVKKDLARAKTWFEKAAAQGHPDAQACLGVIYFRGLGVKKDPVQAKTWFKKAADQGQNQAKEVLAEIQLSEGSAEAGKVVHANHGKEGQAIDLKSLAVPGRRVLVDFYSPLCPPCVRLAPLLEHLAAKTDWIVMKVNINRPGIKVIDWESPVVKQFKLEAVPHLVLLDRQGQTVAEGGIAMEIIERQMQRAGID